jgi:cytoskeletal protein CcmA (bactofilin family)
LGEATTVLGKNRETQSVPPARPTTESPVAGSSTIGQGMTVDGNCETDGFLRIEGKVLGNTTANGLEVTESGTVEGDVVSSPTAKKAVVVIAGRVTGTVRASLVEVRQGGIVLGGLEAEEATVHGRVEGGIDIVRRLAITKNAVIDGEVRTERLMMEEGGRVNGTIRMGRQSASETTPKKGTAPETKTSGSPDAKKADAGGSGGDGEPAAA